MMPSDSMFFVQQQRHREMLREAEQAQLLWATRQTPDGEWAFQHFIWWVAPSGRLDERSSRLRGAAYA